VQPHGAEERLVGLHQQGGPGEARIVEAAPEMHARLDGEGVEARKVERERLEMGRSHDLRQERAQHEHVAAAELHRDKELAALLHHMPHLALDAHRLPGGFVDYAADRYVAVAIVSLIPESPNRTRGRPRIRLGSIRISNRTRKKVPARKKLHAVTGKTY